MQYILFFARARNANAKEKINDEPPSLTSQATVVIRVQTLFLKLSRFFFTYISNKYYLVFKISNTKAIISKQSKFSK